MCSICHKSDAADGKIVDDVVTVVTSIQQKLYVRHADDKYWVSYNQGVDWEEMNKDGLYAYFEADNVLGPWEFTRYSKILDYTFFRAICKDYHHWDDLLQVFCVGSNDVNPELDLPELVFHSGQKMKASFRLQLNDMVVSDVIDE